MNLDSFIVINLFIQLVSSSHLMVFRKEPELSNISDIYPQHEYRRLICVTDRPRDAIVWNTKFNWSEGYFKNDEEKDLKGSELLKHSIYYEQQCRVNVDDKKCFSTWSQQGGKWNIVHSYDVPMGPVYDSRWEDFADFKSKEFEPIKITKNGLNSTVAFGTTGSIAFSLRGQTNAEIMMCCDTGYLICNDDYYNIIISGSTNTPSKIRLCRKYKRGYNCLSPYDGDQHEPLSTHEWRTFVLTWDDATNTIELFDPYKKILSYRNSESFRLNKIRYRNQGGDMLFRFHDYSYTLTTNRGAVLQSSPIILGDSDELCIDMMVGLCKHCGLTVNIIDASGKIRMKKRFTNSNKHDIEHNLPVWQNKRIREENISDYPSPITLELGTSVSSEETDKKKDHWAIRNLALCLPEETVKLVKMTAYQDCNESDCFWNSLTCQRLSYDDPKSEIVEAITMSSTNLNVITTCPDYSIGPNCAIKCDTFFQHNCYGVQVCSENGCSCAQGWQGSNCTTEIPKINHASWAIPLVVAFLCIAVVIYYCLKKRRSKKYLDKERGDGVTESITIHAIAAEEKKFENVKKKKENSSQKVNFRYVFVKTSSNFQKYMNRNTATESIYEDIPDTVDAQGSTSKTSTLVAESKYENLKSNTTSNKQSQLEDSMNNGKHVHQASLNFYF